MLEYMSGALVVASLTLSAVLQNEEAHTSNMSVEELISCTLLHLWRCLGVCLHVLVNAHTCDAQCVVNGVANMAVASGDR